jgi:hypothetical protein
VWTIVPCFGVSLPRPRHRGAAAAGGDVEGLLRQEHQLFPGVVGSLKDKQIKPR